MGRCTGEGRGEFLGQPTEPGTSSWIREVCAIFNHALKAIDAESDPAQRAQLVNLTAALGFTYEKGRRGGDAAPTSWNATDHLSQLDFVTQFTRSFYTALEGRSSDAVCGCVVPHDQPARADHLVAIGPTQNCK